MELTLDNISEIAAMSHFANLIGDEADRLRENGVSDDVAIVRALASVVERLRTPLKDHHFHVLQTIQRLNREAGPVTGRDLTAHLSYPESSLYRYIGQLRDRRLLVERDGGLVINRYWEF